MVKLFKSPDEKRQDAAIAAKKVCPTCNGTGTVGIGGRGAPTASTCGTCGGSGRKT
ncbi:MAG: hypothetical protein WAZ21_02915 [Candidatus Saccharimonadales bacterium]